MRSRACRKCGTIIPHWTVINGRNVSLQNRLFCLGCSPYKAFNRFSDDPDREPNFPSKYKNWSAEEKMIHQARNVLRCRERREQLVTLYGGKCIRCGYSKCERNMQFHHRIPATKCFQLSSVVMKNKSWDEILEEAKKCDLLCANCHGEIEEQISRDKFLDKFEINDMKFTKWTEVLRHIGKSRRRMNPEVKKTCPNCKASFSTRINRVYCSPECRHSGRKPIDKATGQPAVRPTKEQLSENIRNGIAWDEMGRRFNVNGNSVKKWAKNYGLEIPKRKGERIPEKTCLFCNKIFKTDSRSQLYCSRKCASTASRRIERPSKEELGTLLATRTYRSVGQQFGVAHTAVMDWATAYGITTRSREARIIPT